LCTNGDACQAGVCASGAPTICQPLDACHQAGTCDPANGVCTNPLIASCCITAADCDDGNVCTNDACTGAHCVHTSRIGSCDDGNPCTQSDTCQGGTCIGGNPVICLGGAAECDPATGMCPNTPAPGFVPPDIAILKCEDAAAQNLAKLASA